MKKMIIVLISALAITLTNSLCVNAAVDEFKKDSQNVSEDFVAAIELKEDSQNISEDIAEHLGIWTIYSDEFTKPERRLSEDFKSVMKIYNVPIRFAFSEYSSIDEVLTSKELLGSYYVVENTDDSIICYNDSLEEVSSNRYTEIDDKVIPILPIDISDKAFEVFKNDYFIKKCISKDVELKNVYFLSGESCMMGTAIYYRTTAGDYVYYNHYDIGEAIFPIDDFCKYQQAICTEIAKNPDADGGINLSSIWDLSSYTINDNDSNIDDTPKVTTTTSDTTTAEPSTTVITSALTSDTNNDATTTTSTTTIVVFKPQISEDDILLLSKKGESLTWSDFDGYEYSDIGSGLFVWKFSIKNSSSELLIGGKSLDEKPDYINYVTGAGVIVDIRTEDLTPWFYDDASITTSSDTTQTSSTTTTATTTDNENALPQTGYSDIYKVIAGLAALMAVSGTSIVVKTKKETK